MPINFYDQPTLQSKLRLTESLEGLDELSAERFRAVLKHLAKVPLIHDQIRLLRQHLAPGPSRSAPADNPVDPQVNEGTVDPERRGNGYGAESLKAFAVLDDFREFIPLRFRKRRAFGDSFSSFHSRALLCRE